MVQLARPLQEVYQIVHADFVDDFRLGRSKWTTVTAPDVVWDDENYKLPVEPGTRILANVPALSEIDEIVWRMRVAFKDTSGGAFQLEFRRAEDIPNDRYRVTWNQDGTVELEIVDGGIGTSIDTGDVGHVLAEDVTTSFGITITRTIDDDLRIKVYVYENVVIEAVLTGTDILDPGGWAICNTSAINIEIDDVIAYALPVTVDVVSASGVETRSNGVPP